MNRWMHTRVAILAPAVSLALVCSACTARSALPSAGAAIGSVDARSDTAWSALFVTDLNATRATIAANHPGPVDPANPAFARMLEQAYREALADTSLVGDYNSYRVALTRFMNAFQDAHLAIAFQRPFEGVRDAGIYPLYRPAVSSGETTAQEGTFVVEEADQRYGADAQQLRGATVLSCDGQPAHEVFRNHVLSWRGRPGVAADWYRWAPILLVDYGPPNPPVPSRCRFQRDDQVFELPLHWLPVESKDVADRLARLTSFGPPELGLDRLRGGRVLRVTLPTFQVNTPEKITAMRSMIDSLTQEMQRNRSWDLLVFDLRGNSGGSSQWGRQLAAAIFGQPWTDQALEWLYDGVYTEWRVSKENIATLRLLAEQNERQHGEANPRAAALRVFADSMAAALAREEALIPDRTPQRNGANRPTPVKVPGKIAVITSPSCYSACLDFLDVLRLHPAVVQVGHPTGVDTQYIENWSKPLPSDLGRINYSMKVYRGRRRGANEAYFPHVPYPGMLGDTAAVERWIVENYRGW